jgi:hypothetical protein
MLYEYVNIGSIPNLDNIHLDIASSEMSNKTINYCRWDKETEILIIDFSNELIPSDKLKLDDIVYINK